MIGVAPDVSYSTSFRPSTGSTFSGDPLLPTRGEQYEAGIKFEPARGSLVTASVYQITQTNIATPDQAHPGFFIQQGEVRSRGVEVEARVDLKSVVSGKSVSVRVNFGGRGIIKKKY